MFDDPNTRYQGGKGRFEFDVQITSTCVDLQNIFNNSHKKGALDLVIWHVTKNVERTEFKVSGIANDDLFAICRKYGMTPGGEEEMVGDLQTVRQMARQRLQERGWNLG